MGKSKTVVFTLTVILLLLFLTSFQRKEHIPIIGIDTEEDSVKIITFNLRYG